MVTGAHSQSAGEGIHQRPDRSNTKVYLVGAAEDYFEQGRRKVDNDASPAPLLIVFERQSSTVLIAADEWTAPNANRLDQFVSAFLSSADQHANSIDMHDVSAFDTFGAWQLARLARALKIKGRELTITGLPEQIPRPVLSRAGNRASAPIKSNRNPASPLPGLPP